MPNLRSRVKVGWIWGERSPYPAAKRLQSPVKTQFARTKDQCRQSPSQHKLEATRVSRRESPMPAKAGWMFNRPWARHGQRKWSSVRNVRSKCRCSCVLQFTFRRAVSCVLHRPSSQVIHCAVLYFQQHSLSQEQHCFKFHTSETSQQGEEPSKSQLQRRKLFDQFDIPSDRSLGYWTSAPAHRQRSGPLQAKPPLAVSPTTQARVAARQWGEREQSPQPPQKTEKFFWIWSKWITPFSQTSNDPSAGSPTETLLRLLLPLNAQVWESSQHKKGVNLSSADPNTSLKHSIGSSDGRCVQRAGT